MKFTSLVRIAGAAAALFISLSTHAAIVAEFNFTGGVVGDPENVSGSATLDDTGVLSLAGFNNVFVDAGASGILSAQIGFSQVFTGTLTGSNFSAVTITSLALSSCVDTGSTGDFAGVACDNLNPFDTFDVLTQPILFDLTAGGTTVIDWLGGSALIPGSLPLDSNNGVQRFTLTTVPLPTGAWLFGSALIGLAGIKRKK